MFATTVYTYLQKQDENEKDHGKEKVKGDSEKNSKQLVKAKWRVFSKLLLVGHSENVTL